MTVVLSPELEALVRRQVESGPYKDADDVVRAALHLLEERDRRDRLRAAIAVGLDEAARGEVVDWTPDFMDRLKKEAAEEDRLGLPVDDDVRP